MSGNGSKWLTGCGIGCGALLLLLIILGTSGYLIMKSKMQGFAEAQTAGTELERKFGDIKDFCPDPGGAIAPERIRAFLAAREACAPARGRVEASFAGLSEGLHRAREERGAFPQVLRIIRNGLGVIPQLGDFQAARTRALLDAGMGPGEYIYIYVLAYYSWLGKSPGDGPEFRIQGQPGIVAEGSDHEGDAREERRERLTRHIRGVFLAMLGNQRAKLDEGRAEARQDPWREALVAEIAALESNPDRLPWQKGLPRNLEDSLRPFRDPLLQSYSPLVNPLEPVFWMRTSHE